MPELPEVETVRRDLATWYVGQVLEHVSVTGRRAVRRHPPRAPGLPRGRALAGVGRHGKYLLLEWDDGQVLVAHLRMSGQFLAASAGAPQRLHTHAVFSFSAGELHFVDPRTFGELFLATPGAPGRVAELAHMGPDALQVEPSQLASALAGRRSPLKSLLVDQRALAGVGDATRTRFVSRRGCGPTGPQARSAGRGGRGGSRRRCVLCFTLRSTPTARASGGPAVP